MAVSRVYGRLTNPQRAALRPLVRDKVVHDLGAGLCALSMDLATMGARRVEAIDYQTPPPRVLNQLPANVTFHRSPFEAFTALAPAVAVLSWPSLGLSYGRRGVMPIVQRASVVAYLGVNGVAMGESFACGGRRLWEHFAEREVLAYVPAKRNNLLVLGRWTKGSTRPLTPEEKDARWQFFELHEAAKASAA